MKYTILKLLAVTSILLGAMSACKCGPGEKACHDKIESVFLIEAENCADLHNIASWCKACSVSNGILILYNVHDWSDSGNSLAQMRAMNIKLMQYNTVPADSLVFMWAEMKSKSRTDGSRHGLSSLGLDFNPFLISGADYAVRSPGCKMQNVLYLKQDEDNTIDLRGLIKRQDFRDTIKTLGFDSVIYKTGLIEGGDMIWVDSCMILGRRTLKRFSVSENQDSAKAAIKGTYGFCKNQDIEFFLTDDPDLYHLDLYLTYAGKNKDGKNQFFMGYIGNKQYVIEQASAARMKEELKVLYPKFEALLKKRFGTHYQLDSVPIYRGMYLISPLNGISDCIDGTPVYYMPRPTGIIPFDMIDTAVLNALQKQAYDTMTRRIKTKKIDVFVRYMSASAGSGGQSLHCSVGVIRRRGQP